MTASATPPKELAGLFSDEQGALFTVHREDAGRVYFSRQGGGFSLSTPREEFDKRFKPAKLPGYSAILVGLEGFLDEHDQPQTFAAYSNGARWNGWEMPLFDEESARKLCACMPNVSRNDAQDTFVIAPYHGLGDDEITVSAQLIQVDGASIKVYGIGAGEWTWDQMEGETNEDAEATGNRETP